ncbi:hypothetical protein [Cardiobacterium valvarum]|uniref:Uncharacterized protein n=2 Tax=Cardiobacterium valvarum TaxID=194702 RepID=A0A381E021_9GAMM|nr:Uncharacterised protein [Cardiobacterium valvarum]
MFMTNKSVFAAVLALTIPLAAHAAGEAVDAAAGDAVPPMWQQTWEPFSKALERAGKFSLTADSLQWSICGDAARPLRRVEGDAAQGVLYALGEPACQLSDDTAGSKPHYLHLKAGKNACELNVRLLDEDFALIAWGVYFTSTCAADGGGAR